MNSGDKAVGLKFSSWSVVQQMTVGWCHPEWAGRGKDTFLFVFFGWFFVCFVGVFFFVLLFFVVFGFCFCLK